ncbi:MAG TPA: NUDIX domain-containing protein [Gammaproteobacteria bacterium]|nr:NUDIX domain-containing protein [Gammaproteobacteria bacterium]
MRQRVFTYITRDDQLLILEYVDGRYLQPQIPGGTLEKGELPAQAALREAQEETGLMALQLVKCLGSFERDLTDIGRDETIIAWFFHLRTNESTPDAWRHFECDSSEGFAPIEFAVSWVPLSDLPKLGGIDEAMLPELYDSVREQNDT